ncbi:unnamed protein product [Effrenium voratum]|uniref:Uncharacterized protein n=1 Tax=Effrenium voratum TaxID=2562239 RepID=A0AA36ML86_9DINO|nr:unnamed protein product [Effrenium voratum]CAJ1447254.1 unnamed protein product [Effrenium voratum]
MASIGRAVSVFEAKSMRLSRCASGRTFPCSEEDLAARDKALAGLRDTFEQRKGRQLSLGPPLGRKVFVSNLRSKDGRELVPKLTILDSSGVKWMTLTKRDFEQIIKWKDEINQEIIRFKKQMS